MQMGSPLRVWSEIVMGVTGGCKCHASLLVRCLDGALMREGISTALSVFRLGGALLRDKTLYVLCVQMMAWSP